MDNEFIPDAEKQEIIEDGKRNVDLFNCEWMCVFRDKDDFNLQNFWIIDEMPKEFLVDNKRQTFRRAEAMDKSVRGWYSSYAVTYDAAKRKDKPALVVLGIRNGAAEVVMSGYME